MASWYEWAKDETTWTRDNDNWWKRALKGLNWALNPNHAWFDYDKMAEGNVIDKTLNAVETLVDHVANPDVATSIVDKYSGAHLTGAEQEANAFSAEEAQKSRDFTEYMSRNKYQMETQSMEAAGLNPAMVYGGGSLVPTAANGAAASSVAPESGHIGQLLDLIQGLIRFPKELDSMQASIEERWSRAQLNQDLGIAALQNAESNSRQAFASEKVASVREFEAQTARSLADSNIEVNGATVREIAERCQSLQKERSLMDAYLSVAEKNSDSAQKQAIASLRHAEAAIQNAATNSYLSDYQTSLMYAQEILNYANGEGQQIVNRYLDKRQQQELDNLFKQGVKLDAEGRLIDKEGHLVTAQTVKTYVNCATDVANSVSRFVGISAIANKASEGVTQSYLWTPKSGKYNGEIFGPTQILQ